MDDDLAEAMALSMEPSMEDSYRVPSHVLDERLEDDFMLRADSTTDFCFIRSSSSSSTNLIDDVGWRYLRADKICEQLKNWI